MAKTPLYNTDIVPPQSRPELTELADDDIFIVTDESDGKIKKITKENAKETLGVNELAGAGRTTETVKKNADDIADTKADVAQNAADIGNLDGRVDNILVGQDVDPNKDVEVLDARHSNVSTVTYPSIGNRMDSLEAVYGQVGHVYGVKMSRTTGITVYTDDAVGMTYRQQIDAVGALSDFSLVYPWSEIKTVKVNADGAILATIDEPNFQSVVGDIMVKIPVFYSRAFVDGDHECYQVSDVPRTGFRATGFYEPDGSIVPYRLVAATPTSNDGAVPHSWANAPPTVNKALYHATTGFQTQALAKSSSVVWSNITVDVYEMVWRLIFVEIGGHVLSGNVNSLGFNVKGAIGQGINDLGQAYDSRNLNVCTEATSDANTFIIAKTRSQYFHEGMMVQVGSGYSSQSIAKDRYIVSIEEHDQDNDVITLDGDTFTTTLSSQITAWGQPVPIEQIMALGNESGYVLQFNSTVKSHVCYRGIWDLWGNVYQWMTGLYRNDLQFYICHDPVLANVSTPIGNTGWEATGIAPNLANDYLKERDFFDDGFGSFGLPRAVGGGSTTWYAARAYYFNDSYMGVRAVGCGGGWGSGASVGFLWYGSGSPAAAGLGTGGRLIL